MALEVDINTQPFDLKLNAGIPEDVIFRCVGTHNVAVAFIVTGPGAIVNTIDVWRGNTGNIALDKYDAVASGALALTSLINQGLYERSNTIVKFLSFQLKSVAGAVVHIDPLGE